MECGEGGAEECGTHPLRLYSTTNLNTPCLSGTRKVTEYLPGSPGTGRSAVRMWGSSMVKSSCRSWMPEYGSHTSSSGSYLEMYVVYVYAEGHYKDHILVAH